jgi:starch-binding outer membrane protein, SusD/RagB family
MKQIIIFLILFLALSSCEDFLTEVPKDRLSETNFYKTTEDAKAALNAIYGVLGVGGVYGEQYLLQLEVPADYAYGRGSTMPIGGEYTGLDATNARRVELKWVEFYRAINYANIALEKIAEMQIDATIQGELIAEAKYLRAFCYFQLVRDFGACPLRLNSTDGDKPRAPVADVYDAIISDLEAAEAGLPSTPEAYGHATKWFAKITLADVYLYLENWGPARDKAKDVMDNGPFSLVEIGALADWDNLFGGSANGTSEEIFYIKFNHLKGGNGWPFFLSWSQVDYNPYGAYVLHSDPTNPFIVNWDDNDLRKQWDVYTEFTDRTTGLLTQLIYPPMCFGKFRDSNTPGARTYGNDCPIYRYADVLLIYAEAANNAESGPSTLAVDCLNQIKRRGYGYPSTSASAVDYPATGWTVDSFRDAVLLERAYEFMSEGKRWRDLKRTGKAKETILAHLGKTVADKFMWWPISQQEINTNTEIDQADQNPGY